MWLEASSRGARRNRLGTPNPADSAEEEETSGFEQSALMA